MADPILESATTELQSELPPDVALGASEHISGHIPVVLIVAVIFSAITYRFGTSQIARRLKRWLPVAYVAIWSTALSSITLLYAKDISGRWVLIVWLLFIVVAFASVGWLRGVVSGIALAVEKRLELGDSIRIGSVEGSVVAFGVRSVRVRSVDGTVHEIPNQFFMTESVANLSGDGGDSACEIRVALPDGLSPNRALDFARNAAILTPLASPRHRPEVFLESDSRSGDLEILIRGYAFDPAYQDHYRSAVVSRLLDSFATVGATKSAPSGRAEILTIPAGRAVDPEGR